MSLMRRRKKILIRTGVIGIVIGVLLCGSVGGTVYLACFYEQGFGMEHNANEQIQLYQLNRAMSADETIAEADLLEITVRKDSTIGYRIKKSDLIGRKLVLPLSAGTILAKEFINDQEEVTRDLRLVNYDFIKLSDKLKKGDYIDVRISFANGADFVLLSKKKIKDLSMSQGEAGAMNSLWLTISEEELLRMSSAIVDAGINEGSKIYAMEYITGFQEEAIVNYPVNRVVQALIAEDPNIVAKAKNVLVSALRSELKLKEKMEDSQTEYYDTLEEPVTDIYGQETVNQDEPKVEEPSVQEEIQYLD